MIDSDTAAHLRLDDDGAPPPLTIPAPTITSFKLGCLVRGEPDRLFYNALRFASQPECEEYGKDLYRRWTMLESYVVVPTSDPITYRWLDGLHQAVPVDRLEWACLICHRFWPYDQSLDEPALHCPQCGEHVVLRRQA